jgi:hypothetical protein
MVTRNLRDALSFSNESFCLNRTLRIGPVRLRRYAPWTVRTFFAMQCSNPFQERRCGEAVGEEGDRMARLAAIGSLLHAVQDSFSQSHVARIPAGAPTPGSRGPFIPRVVCSAPTRFYDYEVQNLETEDDNGNVLEDPHAVADKRPEQMIGCDDRLRPVDDVITASAAVIYFTRPENVNAQAFNSYIASCVFPNPAESARRRELGRPCTGAL